MPHRCAQGQMRSVSGGTFRPDRTLPPCYRGPRLCHGFAGLYAPDVRMAPDKGGGDRRSDRNSRPITPSQTIPGTKMTLKP